MVCCRIARPLIGGSLIAILGLTTPRPSQAAIAPANNADGVPVAAALSDFDGDGIADLAIGNYLEKIGDFGGGAVNVLYGSMDGLQAGAAGEMDDQFWNQNSPDIIGGEGAEDGDGFGRTLASGDFNNDGFSDLAAAAWEEWVGTVEDAGGLHILYGSNNGLQTTGVGGPDDQYWIQGSDDLNDTPETTDTFARGLAAGDFNGDGFDDLAASADGEDSGTVLNVGIVHVLYGSLNGLQTASPQDQVWNQDSPGLEDGAEENDFFGKILAAGNFNGDETASDEAIDDLAIGTMEEDIDPGTGNQEDAGAVNVLYGSSSAGLQTSDDDFWNQGAVGEIGMDLKDEAELKDLFGRGLAAGNFNGDIHFTTMQPIDDLATGAYQEDVGAVINAGAVHVLYGSTGGLQATSPDDQFWHQDSGGVPEVAEQWDLFGRALATGNFSGDEAVSGEGFDDLAMGAAGESVGPDANAGAVIVLYGSITGLQVDAPRPELWHQDSPSVNNDDSDGGAEPDDEFGKGLAAGNFNDDTNMGTGQGIDDLAMGAWYEDIGLVDRAGSAIVLYGSVEFELQAIDPDDQFWHQNAAIPMGAPVKDLSEENDRFGFSLT
jgi:hypothetical protein